MATFLEMATVHSMYEYGTVYTYKLNFFDTLFLCLTNKVKCVKLMSNITFLPYL